MIMRARRRGNWVLPAEERFDDVIISAGYQRRLLG